MVVFLKILSGKVRSVLCPLFIPTFSILTAFIVVMLLWNSLFGSKPHIAYAFNSGQNTVYNLQQDILTNIKTYGTGSNVDSGKGCTAGAALCPGLWNNWAFANGTVYFGLDSSGNVKPATSDPLTNIRYLVDLYAYKKYYPNDHLFVDSEIASYSAIVREVDYGTKAAPLSNPDMTHAWLFEEFMKLFYLTDDTQWSTVAQSMADGYASNSYYNPQVCVYVYDGTSYVKQNDHTVFPCSNPAINTIYGGPDSHHPFGSYRPDLSLEAGLALIQDGILTNNTSYITKGDNVVKFVYAHAYIPLFHVLPNQMTNVISSPSGYFATAADAIAATSGGFLTSQITAAPNELLDFYGTVQGDAIKTSEQGQVITSLLHTYRMTNTWALANPGIQLDPADPAITPSFYLNKATDSLDAFVSTTASSSNSAGLQMWDPIYLGYFKQANLVDQNGNYGQKLVNLGGSTSVPNLVSPFAPTGPITGYSPVNYSNPMSSASGTWVTKSVVNTGVGAAKEAGRQLQLLEAYNNAINVVPDMAKRKTYEHMRDLMLKVALEDTYYHPDGIVGHGGGLYQATQSWGPIKYSTTGSVGDYNIALTTESMDVTLQALFALGNRY